MANNNGESNGWLSAAATGIAAGAQGLFGAMGLKRKYKYAKKMALYEQGLQKDLNQFNAGLALQQWKDTNAPAQVEQLRKAGLSTGLMYGMGGAGGSANTSTGAGGSAGKMHMPEGEGFSPGGMAIEAGLNLAMQKAQIKLADSQAKNLDADTKNKAGGEAENLAADVANKEVQKENMKVQKEMAEIERDIKSKTQEQILKQVAALTAKIEAEAKTAQQEQAIGRETATSRINLVKQEVTKKTMEILAEKAGIAKTETEKREAEKVIEKLSTEISLMNVNKNIEWEKLDNEQRKAQIQEMLMQFNINEPSQIKKWTDILMPIIMMGVLRK